MCIMQAMGVKKKAGGKWKLKDFMPAKRREQSEELQKAQARALC